MHGILDFSVKKSLMQRHVTAGKKKIILNTIRGTTVVFVHRCAPTDEKFDRFMKIRLIIAVFIGLGVFGCATQHIRSVTIFWIQGRVLDKESSFPLEEVNVFFVDTGYDYTLSRHATPIKVTQSNSRGKIAARFNYLWERRKSAFGNAPKATLDIVLSIDLYKTQTFHFKESELETDGLTFLIDLKDVYMVREME